MKSDSDLQKDVVMHYIERLHTTLTATGVSLNQAYVVQCTTCLITIIVAFGLARSNDLLSLAGLTFSAPLWLIVIGLSVLVAVTFAYLIGLSSHLKRVRKRITELYESIGYDEPLRHKGAAHPLEYPDISSVIADAGLEIKSKSVGRLIGLVNLPILVSTLIALPALAQCSVAAYLVHSFGLGWLDGVYIIFIVVATVTHAVAFVVGSLS